MRKSGLTSALAVLCVPVLIGAAGLLPLAAMQRADRARLETVHPLSAPVDIGAPDAQALQIPLVMQLYRRSVQEGELSLEGSVREGELSDVLAPAELLLDTLPADFSQLLDYALEKCPDAPVEGTDLGLGFSQWGIFFKAGSGQSLGELSVVVAPDNVTPVQMHLYVTGAWDLDPPGAPEDPFAALAALARAMGLEELDWQPEQRYSSDQWWCIRSEQAHLNLVLRIQNLDSHSYFLDIALSSVS